MTWSNKDEIECTSTGSIHHAKSNTHGNLMVNEFILQLTSKICTLQTLKIN